MEDGWKFESAPLESCMITKQLSIKLEDDNASNMKTHENTSNPDNHIQELTSVVNMSSEHETDQRSTRLVRHAAELVHPRDAEVHRRITPRDLSENCSELASPAYGDLLTAAAPPPVGECAHRT